MEIDSQIGRLVCMPAAEYLPLAEARRQNDSLRTSLHELHEAHADLQAEYSRLRLADVRDLHAKLHDALGAEERANERVCELEDLLRDCAKRRTVPTREQIARAMTPNV